MIRITTYADLLLDMILGNGWLIPDAESNLEQDIVNTKQLKYLVDNDIFSIYIHPGLRNFVRIPVSQRFSSRDRVRQEMKKLERYTTSEADISIDQSYEEFEELECPQYSTFDHSG